MNPEGKDFHFSILKNVVHVRIIGVGNHSTFFWHNGDIFLERI